MPFSRLLSGRGSSPLWAAPSPGRLVVLGIKGRPGEPAMKGGPVADIRLQSLFQVLLQAPALTSLDDGLSAIR